MTLFFHQPSPLRAAAHAGLRLMPRAGFRFAATTNAIPLAADEFVLAQAFYPIVFTKGATPGPVAVVGLRDHENLFVDEEGAWRHGHYVPACVRRYPFGLARIDDKGPLVLAVDEAGAMLSPSDGDPLFENELPSSTTKRALAFCTLFEKQRESADAFTAALADSNLLVENRAEWRQPGLDDPFRFGNFLVIDEARFNAMPSDRFLEWRGSGWLPLIYAQFMSMRRWSGLAEAATKRPRPDAEAQPEAAPRAPHEQGGTDV